MAELTALTEAIGRLRLSERYSDLTIECKGKIFKVHCAIVCVQSKVLGAMIDGNWMEATTRMINLKDDSPDMVAKMIDFLYKAQYDVNCEDGGYSAGGKYPQSASATSTNTGNNPRSDQKQQGPLITHAQLYILGDKYDIPSLKELASRSYKETVRTQWNTKDFPESAEIIYSNIVVEKDALKDAIYETARNNISTLISVPGFESVLRRTNDLATDILVSLSHNVGRYAQINGMVTNC